MDFILLYKNLTSYGYEIVYPNGAFYLFMKALESSAVLFVFGLFGLRKQSCRIAIGGVFRRVPFPGAERKQSERIEISFGQNVKTALLSGNE